jgi:hypothetical protein
LGLDEERQLFAYFRRHYAHYYFPNLMRVHRTTFTRQAANLWKVNEKLWQALLADTPHDPAFAICDSRPLPACLFARAYRSAGVCVARPPSARILCSGRPSMAFGCT